MMRFVINTPNVLKALQRREQDVPFAERTTKPFNFVQSPVIDSSDGWMSR